MNKARRLDRTPPSAEAVGFTIHADALRTIPRGREFFHKDGISHGTHSAVEFPGERP